MPVALPTPQSRGALPASLAIVCGDPSMPCREKLNGNWNAEDIDTQERLFNAARHLGFTEAAGTLALLGNHGKMLSQLQAISAAPAQQQPFILNVCDEGYRNDATKELHMPALFELFGLPYTGAGPVSLGVNYDKQWVNSTAEKLGIAVPFEKCLLLPEGLEVASAAQIDELVDASGALSGAPWPIFVKPSKGDNSIGITARSICHSRSELIQYVFELTAAPFKVRSFLFQEFLQGTEYTVGVIGNCDDESGLQFLPILEMDYSKLEEQNLAPIQGYEAKWDPTSKYWTDIGYKPAAIPEPHLARLKQFATTLFSRFECRDYARFDFRAERGTFNIKLLEVNPNPGWCWDGKMAKMVGIEMGAKGAAEVAPGVTRSYVEFVRRILDAGWRRHMRAGQA